ncbi:MAG: hypothetical protein WCE69_08255 [Aestuariivirga sp.]
MAEHDDLSGALRKARLAEAAHFEAVLGIKDSKSLRLQVLKDEIAPVIAATPEAASVFDLALVPGEPPRLWIDLISFVEMEPDYRTYRLQQDNQGGREALFETANRAEMLDYLKTYLAHRMVARERHIMRAAPHMQPMARYTTGAVVYAWFNGLILGILALVVAAISLGKLKF